VTHHIVNVASTLFLFATCPLRFIVSQDPSGLCTHAPEMTAVARSDNDISFSTLDGRRVAIPLPVQRKIDALAVEACFRLRAYSNDTLELARFYTGAFVIFGPDSLAVYVFDRGDEFGNGTYFFILIDPTKSRLTPAPVAIFAKWASDNDDACQRPFVTFEDLDHDGRPELVVRERTHNGTSYNACVRHYYQIGTDLSLWPILAVEERSLQDVSTANTWLLRRVRYISPDSLSIATFLSVPGQSDRQVGEVVVTKHPTAVYHTTNYRLVDTHVLDPKYRDALVTDSPAHDENFLLTGRTLWY